MGAACGIIAGIAMYPLLIIISIVMGTPSDSVSIARGMSISHSYNNNFNLILGIGMHLFTSAISGIIFGFIIKIVNKFKINTFRKGIKEGIVWAIILFIILYIPTTIIVIQPNILEIIRYINPVHNSLQNQQIFDQMIITLYGFGFIAHIVFGVTLGFLISLFNIGFLTKRNR
jgi:hypothetical protein